jgi:two-component system, NarL family, invasion response regulator UvrY
MTTRVLIVDDQAAFREVARAVIDATDGFVVVGESISGEAALEIARLTQPDLILMDVRLPGIDGLEATRRIRSRATGKVVVLLLSTADDDDGAAWPAQCGAAAYISKARLEPGLLKSYDPLRRIA